MSSVILRKFWLENETGDSIPLNGEEGIWLVDPTGLGMSSSSSFTNFSHGFFRPVEQEKDPQQTVAGDLYFIDYKDPYLKYKRFADWIVRASTIYLVYQPSAKQYRRKVTLSSITKDELLTQELLKCPVAFYGLTPWFTIKTLSIRVSDDSTKNPYIVEQSRLVVIEAADDDESSVDRQDEESPDGDTDERPLEDGEFDLVLDGSTSEESSEDDSSESSLSVQPRLVRDYRHYVSTGLYVDGQLPAGFDLSCSGILKDPIITVRESNHGYQIGRCMLANVSLSQTDTFMYSSNYEGSYVVAQIGSREIDLLNNIDQLTDNIYPRLSSPGLYEIELSSTEPIDTTLTVNIYEYFKGV